MNGPFSGYVSSIASDNDYRYAGTRGGGFFRYTDVAGTWSRVNFDLLYYDYYDLLISNDTIFAATNNGVAYSTDQGVNWTLSNNGINDAVSEILLLNGIYYAASGYSGVFVSTDGGMNWNPSNNGLTTLTLYDIEHDGNDLYVATDGVGSV